MAFRFDLTHNFVANFNTTYRFGEREDMLSNTLWEDGSWVAIPGKAVAPIALNGLRPCCETVIPIASILRSGPVCGGSRLYTERDYRRYWPLH